ncbi:type IV conjugative transfer system protein TraL [Piscirickettsia salmonis]|uniref:type IV conjugative transfer system protein TraL n=1 Tax=Piscirickettsia salmonis TaxID=1238 RepID=UPI0006BCC60A|nr:type IV conjugative transfer system protein TraL [Piscirickettsia salmonis]ALA26633.1 conjugal transfer protein TraL [Piscirickettsia salmonis]APS45846.1 conjugal transfer protein TraL [Piscirickettsia salmonis]APS49271.1 conjugal transfer protein TraL [Piscirickettsia salmonis]QGO82342.1 conjugal transfer pilus assembly protein TraL [Piscirickettsia salmonis]QGP24171.1 conjugal transfer pilus assembly protein TraL [Piscirickettsia salmonis]
MSRSYETFILSDEPKLFGIPIVSGLPCIALTIIGLLSGYGFQLFVVGAITSLLLHVKFGADGIRFFLSIIYWFLPSKLTRVFFWRSPDSAHRLYLK